MTDPIVDPAVQHRLRLLEGLIAALARKEYATVTIADVVSEAGVSKRTFYEHFADKEDCLLACYAESATMVLAQIRQQLSAGPRSVLNTYLSFLDRAPQLAATLLVEVRRAGTEGRRLYRRNNIELALLIRDSVTTQQPAGVGRFTLDQAVALVGGLNELVLTHAEDSPDLPFQALVPAAVRFVEAVLGPGAVSSRTTDARSGLPGPSELS
jgi:AcrR family transcriptional regulator